MNKIFLGGTCGKSTWRDQLIPCLNSDIQYFNPVVADWTPECQEEEYRQKNDVCNIHLYVITNEMKGVFSIAEVVDSVHTKSVSTILQVMPEGFDDVQLKSLKAVVGLIQKRGGIAFVDSDIRRMARVLNNSYSSESAKY